MQKNTLRSQGFTIVELLIVIVVVGILAAITVVAYNGIQKRAYQASILSAVDYYEKVVRMYKETYGSYPTGKWDSTKACLGNNYKQTPLMAKDACWSNGGGLTYVSVDAELNKQLAEFSTSVPEVPMKDVDFGTEINSRLVIRGVVYTAANYNGNSSNQSVTIEYALDGTNNCGRGYPTTVSSNGVSYNICSLELANFTTP